jgi:hypothetical protein
MPQQFGYRRTAQAAPADLYGVYDRIVPRINKKYLADVHPILQWLSFAFETLNLNQVAQVVGVILDQESGLCFEPSQIYRNPRSVLLVCSSFVMLVNGIVWSLWHSALLMNETGTVMLSHMSVKDYLLTRTHEHKASTLAINEKMAHSSIAQTCLGYLLQFTASTRSHQIGMEDFPLAYYAVRYWTRHVHSGPPKPPDMLLELMKTLFQLPCSSPFTAWVEI